MKTNNLIVAGITLVLAFCLNNSQAQTTNAPAPGPAPGAPMPVQPGQRFPSPKMNQPRQFIMRTLSDLRNVKIQLQRSQDDYGGHKDPAIEACDKAMLELDAILKTLPPLPSPRQAPQPGAGAAPQPAPLRIAPTNSSVPGAQPAPPAPNVQPAQPQP